MSRYPTGRRIQKGAGELGAASTLPLSGAVAAAPPRRTGRKPDMDEVDPVQFERGDAVEEYERVETRTGAEIWVDVVGPDTGEEVPTITVPSPYYNTLGCGWRGELEEPHDDELPHVGPPAGDEDGRPGRGPGDRPCNDGGRGPPPL